MDVEIFATDVGANGNATLLWLPLLHSSTFPPQNEVAFIQNVEVTSLHREIDKE